MQVLKLCGRHHTHWAISSAYSPPTLYARSHCVAQVGFKFLLGCKPLFSISQMVSVLGLCFPPLFWVRILSTFLSFPGLLQRIHFTPWPSSASHATRMNFWVQESVCHWVPQWLLLATKHSFFSLSVLLSFQCLSLRPSLAKDLTSACLSFPSVHHCTVWH